MNYFAPYTREFSAMRSRACTVTHGRKLAYARELSAMRGRVCTATHGRKLAYAFVKYNPVHFLTLVTAKPTQCFTHTRESRKPHGDGGGLRPLPVTFHEISGFPCVFLKLGRVVLEILEFWFFEDYRLELPQTPSPPSFWRS